jgi:[acyl-carrier-protein] S-malonyltransferase
MGADLASTFPDAQAVFERADELLGFGLSSLMFGSATNEAGADGADDAEILRQTEITQPALLVHSIAVVRILEGRGFRPGCVAGHSLGEYSGLTAAGALTFEDGLRIVRLRGELMAGAGDVRPGTMAAVLGVDDKVVDQICVDASTDIDVVQPANYNSPGQVVISGDVKAVDRAMEIASERGARRVIPLPVSGAFHSPLMEHARAGLAKALGSLAISQPSCPVYLNVSAAPTTEPSEIRRALLDQLTSPVRWSQTLTNMNRDGFSSFLEVGSGKVLTGLVRRTLGRDVEARSAGIADDFQ